jgi:CheY-like chemotaxis protein
VPKELVLLVEREAKTRRLLKVSLEQAGYAVATARDGVDAMRKLEMTSPALVLTATTLPKLDGYALVRRIKENSEWARLPIVFMVDSDSIEDKIRGLELGVEDYLNKPVFVKELVSRVQVLLAKQVSLHLSESVADTRVAGSLSDLPTVDLLESLEQGGQSGIVRISWGDRTGEVVFEDGEIVDARLRRLRGEEVVYRLLCLTEGTFEVTIGEIDGDRIIESGTRALIEAGMRHAAEYNRLLEGLPSQDEVVVVDRAALEDRLGDVPDQLEGILGLLDGRRTVFDIIDDSPFDDISTLQTLARLQGEALLIVPATEHTPIPAPPRTPTPPGEDRATSIYEPLELEDDAPTLRPPAVAERVPADRVPRIVPGALEPEVQPLALDPSSQRLEAVGRDDSEPGELGPETPPRGSLTYDEAELAGVGDDSAAEDSDDEEPAPDTPRRGGEVRSSRSPTTSPAGGASGPKSSPPATEDVDAAFQAVLSEIPSEYPSPILSPERHALLADEEVGEVVPPTGRRDEPSRPVKSDWQDEPAPLEEPYASEPPSAELPSAELPSAELPSAELPSAELPSAELPSAELPSAELPSAELPSRPSNPKAAAAATASEPPASDPLAPFFPPSYHGDPSSAESEPPATSSPRIPVPEQARAASEPAASEPPAPGPLASDPPSSEPPSAGASDAGGSTPPSKSSRAPGKPSQPPSSDRASSKGGRPKRSDAPPSSGLGRSGVSEGFFARPPTDPEAEELPPNSDDEPVYLTENQVARKRTGMRLVAVTVGILGALILFVTLRNRGKDGPPKPTTAPSATVTTTAPSKPVSTASAAPPPSASASAVATGDGGKGGAGDGGKGGAGEDGKGGASDGGADGAGGKGDAGSGGALPEVDDPLKEAQKLIGGGQYKKGIPFAKAAVAKEPGNGDAWFWLATGYESIGKMDDAKQAYGKCAENKASPQFLGYCKQRAPK